MGKTISDSLYNDLIQFFIYEDKTPALEGKIISALEKKVEAMARRQTYTEKVLSDNQKRARDERV